MRRWTGSARTPVGAAVSGQGLAGVWDLVARPAGALDANLKRQSGAIDLAAAAGEEGCGACQLMSS